MIEFVFMLTHHDATVPDALEVLDEVRDSPLRYVGFKDVGASADELAEIAEAAHGRGLEVMLEVVSTTAEDERRSLEAAPAIGVDWVLGGTHVDDGVRILSGTGLRYCPFPGRVVDHPSVLHGEIDEIAEHARALTERDGVHGLDLLAYRHPSADVEELTRAVVRAANGPVIAAGSVASVDQIHALARAGAWGFTIGGAIFEGQLPGGPAVADQVAAVVAVAESASAMPEHSA
jgi:sugar phosphate isomerase/epimerase